MQNEERALNLLAEGKFDNLTIEEKQWLVQNLESEDLQHYSEVILEFKNQLKELKPNLKSKELLLERFKTYNSDSKEANFVDLPRKLFTPFKVVAASIVGLGIVGLFYMFYDRDLNYKSNISEQEFIQFTQLEEAREEEVEPDSVKRETRFLMHMDFFSNASIGVDSK